MESYISIKVDKNVISLIEGVKNKDIIYTLLYEYMRFLNHLIGFSTNIEYRINPVSNLSIMYEVKNYTNEQTKMNINDLAMEKFNTIVNFCKTIEEEKFNTFILWVIRNLQQLFSFSDSIKDIKVKDILIIRAICKGKPFKSSRLCVKIPHIIKPTYEVERFKGGTIRQFIDPYIKNTMICIDYSKPLQEMSYFYNCLHMYEHYVTHAWEKLSSLDVLDINGSTYFNGLCYVYTVTDKQKTAKDRLISSILFHIKSSDVEFVRSNKAMETETFRTISEAYTLRNITRLGRSDQQAYEGVYSPEVFAYWSSLPMNILVITNEKIDINLSKINEFYDRFHVDAKQPKKPTFDWLPLESHEIHYLNSQHTFKRPTEKILEKIYNNACKRAFYGIDNKTYIYQNEIEFLQGHKDNKNKKIKKEDLGMYQSHISPLLFFANYVDDTKVRDYISKNVFPREASLFETTAMNWCSKNNFNSMLGSENLEEE